MSIDPFTFTYFSKHKPKYLFQTKEIAKQGSNIDLNTISM